MRALGRAAVMQEAALSAMIALGLTAKGLRWYLRDQEQRE